MSFHNCPRQYLGVESVSTARRCPGLCCASDLSNSFHKLPFTIKLKSSNRRISAERYQRICISNLSYSVPHLVLWLGKSTALQLLWLLQFYPLQLSEWGPLHAAKQINCLASPVLLGRHIWLHSDGLAGGLAAHLRVLISGMSGS